MIFDDKGVRTITLQRPEKKNALDAEMFDALTHRLKEAAADQEVKVGLKKRRGILFPLRWWCSQVQGSTSQVAMTWGTSLLPSQKVWMNILAETLE